MGRHRGQLGDSPDPTSRRGEDRHPHSDSRWELPIDTATVPFSAKRDRERGKLEARISWQRMR